MTDEERQRVHDLVMNVADELDTTQTTFDTDSWQTEDTDTSDTDDVVTDATDTSDTDVVTDFHVVSADGEPVTKSAEPEGVSEAASVETQTDPEPMAKADQSISEPEQKPTGRNPWCSHGLRLSQDCPHPNCLPSSTRLISQKAVHL